MELSFSLLKISNFIVEWSIDWLLRIVIIYILSTLLYLVNIFYSIIPNTRAAEVSTAEEP